MKNTCLLIDGGYMRARLKAIGVNTYNAMYIYTNIVRCYANSAEDLHRIFFYDAPSYKGRAKKPISGEIQTFEGDDTWLEELGHMPWVALRLGVLAFRGWTLRNTKKAARGEQLSDEDFNPNIAQKGVDMRIGIDITNICAQGGVDRLLVASADSDMVPALKHARTCGIQVGIIEFSAGGESTLHKELKLHSDFVRRIELIDYAEFQTQNS